MHKILTTLMIVLVLTALFTGCVRQTIPQNSTMTITFVSNQERIPFAQLQIFQNGKLLQTQKADATGMLKLELKSGDYRFDFTDGFLTGSRQITVSQKSQSLQLEPTDVEKGKTGFVNRLRDDTIKTDRKSVV